MSKNINQVYIANPITSNATTDLIYIGQSPYLPGDDAAITYGDFSNQFVSPEQTPFIVSPNGPYTTIQSAINAAESGATSTNHHVVLINSGTYNENLTLKSFVDITSFGGSSNGSVNVIGNASYTPVNDNESFTCNGISFQTPLGGGSAFSISGVKICSTYMHNTGFMSTNGTGYTCSNSNATINILGFYGNATSGNLVLNCSGGTTTIFCGHVISTDTQSILSGDAELILSNCFYQDSFNISGTSQLSVVNTTTLPVSTLPFVTIGPTSIAIIFCNNVVCNAVSGYWATGTGAIAANSITSNAGSAFSINPALTQIAEPLLIGKLSFNGGLNTFITSGDFDVTQTYTGNTNVTFPVSGTLATTSQLLTSPLTTKGDLWSFSTVDARLAVGTVNGQILQVNSATATGLSYSTPTYPSSSGTSGKVIISDGTNNVYSTPTFPNASATTGKFIRSDGTNWIASTPTLPTTAGTSGKILQSDGTNYVESTPTYPSASGSVGKILRSDGTNNVYSTSTFADTYTANTILYASGTNAVTGGTAATIASLFTSPTSQTFTSGSGTYTTPANCKYIVISMQAGGGGGGGSANTGGTATSGGNGGNTTFSTLTAGGGTGGDGSNIGTHGGNGGTATGGNLLNIPGQTGGSQPVAITLQIVQGGIGGNSFLGFGGNNGNYSDAGSDGTGFGGGGQGGALTAGNGPGSGGGGGGFIKHRINSPAASYSYGVGAAGAAGTAGTGGVNAGAGKIGYILVEEYYI